MRQNPNEDERRRILEVTRNVAVVGLSDNSEKTSHKIAGVLQAVGYRIFPGTPDLAGPVLDERPYASVEEIEEPIYAIAVFRRGEDAVGAGAKTLWMQRGVSNEEVAEDGLSVVMYRCMRKEYHLLAGHAQALLTVTRYKEDRVARGRERDGFRAPGPDQRRDSLRRWVRGMPEDGRRLGISEGVPGMRLPGLLNDSKNKHATKHFHSTNRPLPRASNRGRTGSGAT